MHVVGDVVGKGRDRFQRPREPFNPFLMRRRNAGIAIEVDPDRRQKHHHEDRQRDSKGLQSCRVYATVQHGG